MASTSRLELAVRIADVEELISAHGIITGGGRGRPAENQGRAITRAAIVLLAAANEAFIEDLFHEATTKIFPGMSDDEQKNLFGNTTKKLNTASVQNIEMLYFNLGMPFVLKDFKWQGFSNKQFRKKFNRLIEVRGSIAHGRPQAASLQSLKSWKSMIECFAIRFEQRVANNIRNIAGTHPGW